MHGIPVLTLQSGATQSFTAETSVGVTTSTSNALNFAYKAVGPAGAVTFPTWSGTVSCRSSVWIGISLALRGV
jgi:hypothetical protein